MKVMPTAIPDVLLIEPKVFGDTRGFFYESLNQKAFNQATSQSLSFVQDNHSRSAKGVLRGLHCQIQQPQGKLVRVMRGAVFSVAVDIRHASPTFGQWVGMELSEENHKQLWIPAGFAHGFMVTSAFAELMHRATNYYAPAHERCMAWNDPTLGSQRPLTENPAYQPKISKGWRCPRPRRFNACTRYAVARNIHPNA
ncbi:MAG: dTDP-4-dehydrorhamnose 3,5-epimerase [Polaromonas sp.]|nr:dTDP-4-dehydrorhamnose 3,5-epimerase [Polaromonas sp.]